uniref:Uncharacterized protein n=1 Tax=Mycena chlorophos TaxID=658473 RepID=A0ABQ0KV08_MYCCL|nr:predicted protein [Mycena chlorophos]
MSPIDSIRTSLTTHDDWEELISETRKLLRAARSAHMHALLQVCEHSTMLGALREGFEQWKAVHGEEVLVIAGPPHRDVARSQTAEASDNSQEAGPQLKRRRADVDGTVDVGDDEEAQSSAEEKEMDEEQ